jgi:probable addiction module antidote protein
MRQLGRDMQRGGGPLKRKPNPQAALLDRLNKDEAYRIEYLNHALKHENQRMILAALRNVAKATGGISRLSKSTGFNRQHLYRTLSDGGNPTWIRIIQIFNDLGYPLPATRKPR